MIRTEHLQLRKRVRRQLAADVWTVFSFDRFLTESVNRAKGLQTIWTTTDAMCQSDARDNILNGYHYILG